MSNLDLIRGRQVLLYLTNKSGGAVAAGDVVVLDTANDAAFTTTTSGGYTGAIGVVQESIASNAQGRVLVEGYAALVNVNASVTRGQYGKTYTVAKQATGAASRTAGTFCQWLTGGTTPSASLFGAPDLSAGGASSPLTTKGDVWGYSSTDARIPIGSDGQVLTADSGQTLGLKWAAAGGGSATINRPALTPGTPTADFADSATLSTDGWTAHSSAGSFALSDCFKQSEPTGSFLEMGFSAQMGAIYLSTTNTDQEWIVGDLRLDGDLTGNIAVMPGIAILNSSGTGVGMLVYNDGHIYLASIVTWNYSSFYGSVASSNGVSTDHNARPYQPWWLRLTRVGNTWDGYVSMSGKAWDLHMSATGSNTITADRKCIGLFYNTGGSYSGRLRADWVNTV